MGSRLRENPTKLIECWCEIVGSQGPDQPPWIIQKFPNIYKDEEVLKSIPQFTFPCTFEKSAVQHFSFVLTNLESKFLYGFCRHAPDSDTALVILSHLPWHELFYKILNHCSTLMTSEKPWDLWDFLEGFFNIPVPSPGTIFTVIYGANKTRTFLAECPNHISLPSIPENRNLSEYFSAVDVNNMMIIFASMLNERRIIVTSEKVSRLSACVQAANSLIYPMSWQHIFIPVLPEHLLDYLNAPMPFLIGVALPLMQKVRLEELGDVVILNADTNRITTPFTDLRTLPEEVTCSLKKNLSPPNNLLGDGVARAFLKALVHLIGNYREALQFRDEDKKITFNQEKFVTQRPLHFQPFVEKMLELQIFRQFIEERLDLLNSGLHTSDEFELEASVYGERSSSKMKQILTNVKKESGAIMKNVKNKTNPAMKSAVKSVTKSSKNVREKGRTTYKELRGKLKDIQQKSTETPLYLNGTKPRSAPSSPTLPPKRALKSISGVYEGYSARSTYKRASQPASAFRNKSSSGDSSKRKTSITPPSSEDSQKTPSPQEIDLIGEMEDVLKTHLVFSATSSLQETTSTVSINSSVMSSAPGEGVFPIEFPADTPEPSKEPLTNGDAKHLSASLTSLPLLDLSLNIPLPPPLFPPAPSSQQPLGERVPLPPYRSPKILPSETFGSLPSSLEGVTVNSSRTSAFGDGSSPPARPKAYTLPVGGERKVGGDPGAAPPRKRVVFPKYDVSPSFSASLAKFSSRGASPSSSYYFSSLSKASSRSTDSVLDFEAAENPLEEVLSPPKGLPSASPLSPPDVLCGVYPSTSPRNPTLPPSSWDVMTMSLPMGLASIHDLPPLPSASSSSPCPTPPQPSLPALLSPPPRSRRRRKKVTPPAQEENGSSQDLLFLDSPKEEEFDPLLVKDIPPPIPTRHQKNSFVPDWRAGGPSFQGPRMPPPAGQNSEQPARLVSEPPGKLQADRYLPFSALQEKSSLVPSAVQNPLYNPHVPPFARPRKEEHDRGLPKTLPPNNNSIMANNCINNNNPAAAFAASLIGEGDTGSPGLKTSRPLTLPSGSFGFAKPQQETMTEQDLLGDFSSDFRKLSVATKGAGKSSGS